MERNNDPGEEKWISSCLKQKHKFVVEKETEKDGQRSSKASWRRELASLVSSGNKYRPIAN